MSKSHVARESEASKYGVDFEFDPALDFSEFLDQARRHICEEASPRAPSPVADIDRQSEFKKSKKPWKNSLLSWWPKARNKFEKKSKSRVEPASSSQSSNPMRNHISGPIYMKSSGTRKGKPGERPHCSSSGPLMGLFRSSRVMENEIPYAALDDIDPRRAKPYGPVYFVT
ncbi:uncharacterized protein LOC115736466 [Rhodamnia argentea]|uniref:Uncharacterized protein LOC115736466 n=1 Tax=Rhodamnia argentea TaxID=178133 RepID=A0A8B8NQ23_9MYRT|nr:uncharacterized protein LOC115736466 [Rhodamnia argentea]